MSSLSEMVEKGPAAALEKYAAMKAAVEALEAALQEYVEKNGPIKSASGCKYSKVTKEREYLSQEQVLQFCKDKGIDPYSIGSLSLTEKGISAHLGSERGADVIDQLRAAGLVKKTKFSYFTLKVPTT